MPEKKTATISMCNQEQHFMCHLVLYVVGDGMAGFAVRNPSGQIVKPYQWQATADYTDQVSPGGYYSVCIDNQFSRFAGKLVNIYITVTTIGTVERNINDMLAYQYHSRNREARDFALVMDNNTYIQTFSVCQL
ncbi:hypothetical protein DOY81_010505 [Sarcophaga bullata]|nr:hypothetical protein DOY81_010505 [Sarcophaga bullata]